MKAQIYWMPYSEESGFWPAWGGETKKGAIRDLRDNFMGPVPEDVKVVKVRIVPITPNRRSPRHAK